MSLPPFWLKITKQHVIENFEDLIQYLKRYPSDEAKDQKNEDFIQTCALLKSVADDYIPRINAFALYEEPSFDIPIPLLLRILAASLYTEHFNDGDPNALISPLIRLLMLSDSSISPERLRRYLDILKACMTGRRVRHLNYTLNDLDTSFSQGIFKVKLSGMTFHPATTEAPAVYCDYGCLTVKGDSITLTDVGYTDSERSKLKEELASDTGISVRSTTARGRKRDIEALLQSYPAVIGDYRRISVQPTSQVLKKYTDSDYFLVRITAMSGYNIWVETIDPGYEKESGKVFIDNGFFLHRWLPVDRIKPLLKVGTCLPVVRNQHPTIPFRLDKESLSEFLRDYVYEFEREDLRAIFIDEINGGTKWLCDRGFYLNLFDIDLDATALEELNYAIREDIPCEVRLDSISTNDDNSGGFRIKGVFRRILPEPPVENRDLFEDRAFTSLFEEFLHDCQAQAATDIDCQLAPLPVAREDVRLLAMMIYRLALCANTDDSFARIEQLIIAMLLMHLVDSPVETDYILHQLNFQKALIQFSRGESPAAISLSPVDSVSTLDEVQRDHRLIEILQGYKEHFVTSVSSIHLQKAASGSATLADDVRQLVAASNSILDKIDISEINRIKKTICSRLGVADEYTNICGESINYGSESEFLEFKSSCVLPPSNLSTGSLMRDMELQKWNILKPICAFLNSDKGGELLIGVSDSGTPLGLDSDIRTLAEHHIISEPTADRLRQYIKLFVDRAFITHDGRVRGTAITSDLIRYNIEEYKEGGEILRIIVKPYPWDIVRFDDAQKRPERFLEAYIRTSGASTPLTPEGINQTRMRKLKALDKDDLKLRRIMSAITDKKVVEINNYFSKEGAVKRRLEPYRILHNRKAFLAYDLDRRDMRIFKLARFKDSDLVITDRPYSNEDKHADRSVDLFGMMETQDSPAHTVVMQLTDYAWCLMMEEYNITASHVTSDTLKVTEDRKTKSDTRYPWTVEVRVNHFAGIARFIMGLPGQIRLISPVELADYIAAARE